MSSVVKEKLDSNIEILKEKATKNRAFGTSYVQRICQIGYNEALSTIQRAIDLGIIEIDTKNKSRYYLQYKLCA